MRKLRSTTICGTEYREYLAAPNEHPDLPDTFAITDNNGARILYNKEYYNPRTHAQIRLHELVHIALFQTGFLVRLQRDLKPTANIDDVEEDAVNAVTSALAPLFGRKAPK